MIEDIRTKAVTKVKKKKAFYIVATIFGSISIILIAISLNFTSPVSYWIQFPILILFLILSIIYVSLFGISFGRFMNEDWEEEAIEKEMVYLYKNKSKTLPPPEDLTEEEVLELKELEMLKEKWGDRSDYV